MIGRNSSCSICSARPVHAPRTVAPREWRSPMPASLRASGSELKLREFKNLDYPNAMRREVCETLMQESGNVVWRIVGALQAQI